MMSEQLKTLLRELFEFQEYVVVKEGDECFEEILGSDELQKYFTPIEMEHGLCGCVMSLEVYNIYNTLN